LCKAGKVRLGEEARQAVIEVLTNQISVTIAQLTSILHLPSEKLKEILTELIEQGIVKRAGTRYELKN
jgi:DNA-binding IclR family transcriptional regulator